MKKIISAAIAIALFAFPSCRKEFISGDGPVVTEVRVINNFRGVSSSMPGKVNFKIDPVYKVEIQAQQNILDVLRTHVVNGVLEIDFGHNIVVRHHEPVIINISAPSPDYLRVSGAGDINIQGDLVSANLGIDISGNGNITIQKATIADKIDSRISGSGNISINAGSAINEELRVSGSGSMDVSNVPAKQAWVHVSGSGDLKVNLSQSLEAHISGSGSVYYRGNPTISSHVSGSGKIVPM